MKVDSGDQILEEHFEKGAKNQSCVPGQIPVQEKLFLSEWLNRT